MAWAPSVVEPSPGRGRGLDVSSVLADRGDILGAGGQPIVTERPVSRVGIDKTQLDGADPAESARALAQLVGIDVGPYVKAVKAAGAQAFVEAIVFRQRGAAGRGEQRRRRDPGRAGSSPPTCRSARPATSRRRSSAGSAR